MGAFLMALGGFLAVSRSPLPPRAARRRAARDVRRCGAPGRLSASATMKTVRWSIPLAIFVVLVAFLWVGLGRDPREVPSPLIGKPAPAFTLASFTIRDKRLSTADLKGKVWLLNVWASWCVSCRVEHPLLVQLAKANIVPVVGLDYKDKPDDGRAWLAQNGDPVHDVDRRPATAASASTTASTACRRRSSSTSTGVIRYKQIGPITVEALQRQDPAAGARAAEVIRCAAWRCGAALRSDRGAARPARRGQDGRAGRRRGARRCASRSSRPSCAAWSARTRRSPTPTRTSPTTCASEVRELARRRQDRRRDPRLSGRALRRLRALRPAGEARRPGCCGSGRSCCSLAARALWWAVLRRRAARRPAPAAAHSGAEARGRELLADSDGRAAASSAPRGKSRGASTSEPPLSAALRSRPHFQHRSKLAGILLLHARQNTLPVVRAIASQRGEHRVGARAVASRPRSRPAAAPRRAERRRRCSTCAR